jgi:hypothetical protein
MIQLLARQRNERTRHGGTMSFTADHEAIRQFGLTLAGLTDDADRASGYANSALDIDDRSSGMFFTVMQTAASVSDALTANYRHLAKIVDASAIEVGKVIEGYRESDQSAAGRLDATY